MDVDLIEFYDHPLHCSCWTPDSSWDVDEETGEPYRYCDNCDLRLPDDYVPVRDMMSKLIEKVKANQ